MNDFTAEGRRTAKIYFCRGNESLVKDMAASIRNQKSHAHLIDQQHFTGAETVLAANAVLIQADAPKARMIGRTYAEFGTPGVEVLFFDGEGKITKLELVDPEQSFAAILGSASNTDEGANNDGLENDVESPAPEFLGSGTDPEEPGTDEAAGLADSNEGDSAQSAENIKS